MASSGTDASPFGFRRVAWGAARVGTGFHVAGGLLLVSSGLFASNNKLAQIELTLARWAETVSLGMPS